MTVSIADPFRPRWVWLYADEASHLPLSKAPQTDPVVIGEFIWNGAEELVLNVRSIERALAAVEFFDRYLPRALAGLARMTVINRLFSYAEMMAVPGLQTLFENIPLTERDPEALAAKLQAAKERHQDVRGRNAAFARIVQELTQQPEPEMESFPAHHYYEDGIAGLRLILLARQAVAIRHWQGTEG